MLPCNMGFANWRSVSVVESSRPDGQGSYTGKVSIREQGPSFSVDWKLRVARADNLTLLTAVTAREGLPGTAPIARTETLSWAGFGRSRQ